MLRRIGLRRKRIKDLTEKRERARLPEKKRAWTQAIDEARREGDRLARVWEAFKKEHPDEARKAAGSPTSTTQAKPAAPAKPAPEGAPRQPAAAPAKKREAKKPAQDDLAARRDRIANVLSEAAARAEQVGEAPATPKQIRYLASLIAENENSEAELRDLRLDTNYRLGKREASSLIERYKLAAERRAEATDKAATVPDKPAKTAEAAKEPAAAPLPSEQEAQPWWARLKTDARERTVRDAGIADPDGRVAKSDWRFLTDINRTAIMRAYAALRGAAKAWWRKASHAQKTDLVKNAGIDRVPAAAVADILDFDSVRQDWAGPIVQAVRVAGAKAEAASAERPDSGAEVAATEGEAKYSRFGVERRSVVVAPATGWAAIKDKLATLYRTVTAGPPSGKQAITIGEVSADGAELINDKFRQAGVTVDVAGYQHEVDAYALRHIVKEHGSAATEAPRGQLPITDADVAAIPGILAGPDAVEYVGKTATGLDGVGYWKQVNGTVLYVEEARTGGRTLSAVTIRKYKNWPKDAPGRPDGNAPQSDVRNALPGAGENIASDEDERHSLRGGQQLGDIKLSAADKAKIKDKLRSILKQLAPKANLAFVDDLVDGIGAGKYLQGLVTVSLGYGDPEVTLRHEAIHALKEMGLFDKPEWAVLEEASRRDKEGMRRIAELYPDLSKAAQVEEWVAQKFGEFRAGKAMLPKYRRVFAKVRDLLTRFANALRGLGFTSAESIFERVERGEVGGRPGEATGADEARYAAADPMDKRVPIVEVAPRFADLPYAEARSAARDWIIEHLRGRVTNADRGWAIDIFRNELKKATSGPHDQRDFDIATAIPQLLESAVWQSSAAPTENEPEVNQYHYFTAAAEYRGQIHAVRVIVQERTDGRRFYDQHSVESVGPAVPYPGARSPDELTVPRSPSEPTTIRVGDLLGEGKSPSGSEAKYSLFTRAAAAASNTRAGKAVSWTQKLGQNLSPLGALPEKNKYLARRYLALGEVAHAEDLGRKTYDTFKRAGPADKQAQAWQTMPPPASGAAASARSPCPRRLRHAPGRSTC